jgi:4-amino-4-deoxy-L-arabinose transferase-like glycosyltransferase
LVDSAYYHHLGVQFSEGQLTTSLAYYLAPLYSYVMGGLYALVGVDLEWLRALQCLLGSASCVLLYWIGCRVFSRGVGILSGFLLAFYGLHIFYTAVLLPTILVVFLNLLFLWLIVGDERGLTSGRSALAGVAIGLAVLAKPNALLLLPMALAVLFLLRKSWPGASLSRCAGALSVASVLTVAPATLNNYLATGEFVFVTTSSGRNLMKGNGPEANGTHRRLEAGVSIASFLSGNTTPKKAVLESKRMLRRTTRHIRKNPGAAVKLLAKKSLLFVNEQEFFVRDNADFAERYSRLLRLPLPGFGIVGSLGLAGALLAWRRWREGAFLYGLLLTQIVSITLVFVLARYRLVAVGCLIIFASFFLLQVIDQLRARKRKAIAISIATLLATTVLVHIPFPEVSNEQVFSRKLERIEMLEKRSSSPSAPAGISR